MADPKHNQLSTIEEFRVLHASGCFVLPNPWDVGTAVYLQHVGFKALATTGADCLYAPGVNKPEEIAAIVKAVAPKPVNVLVSSNNCDLSVSQLTDLGVRRISVGSALARVAWGAFIRAAGSIRESGRFDSLADAASFAELNELFLKRG